MERGKTTWNEAIFTFQCGRCSRERKKKEKTGETDTKRRDAAEGDGWWQVVRPGVVIKGGGARGVSGRLAKRFLFLFSFWRFHFSYNSPGGLLNVTKVTIKQIYLFYDVGGKNCEKNGLLQDNVTYWKKNIWQWQFRFLLFLFSEIKRNKSKEKQI